MRKLAATLLFLVALGSLPAGADGRAPAARVPERGDLVGPREAAAAALRPGLLPEAMGASGTRATWDALVAKLTAPRGRGGSGLTQVGGVEAGESWFWAYPFTIGDVDGDGLDDVLTFEDESTFTDEGGYSSRTLVRARKGTDGSVLWSTRSFLFGASGDLALLPGFEFAGLFILVGDVLEGDAQEIVVYEIALRETWPVSDAPVMQRLTVLSTADGRERWAVELPGRITSVGAGLPLGGGRAALERQENIVYGISSIGDVTGDGEGDLFVSSFDSFEVASTAVRRLEVDNLGRVLSSETGEVARSVATSSDGEWQELWPAPDLTGDGEQDLLLLTPSTLTATSFDATTEHWQSSVKEDTYVFLYTDDVTAEAPPDVVVVGFSFDDAAETFAERISVYAGATGVRAWSRRTRGVFLDGGELSGGGAGQDFYEFDWLDDATLRVRAVSGADGNDLWQQTEIATSDLGEADMLAGYPVDLTGDGARDLRFAPWVHVDEIDDEGYLVRRTIELREFALDAADRSRLWDVGPVASFEEIPWEFEDFDGDGAEDLATIAVAGSDATLAMLRGRDLAPLWSATKAGVAGDWFAYGFGANLAGDGDRELVLSYFQDGGETGASVNEILTFVRPGVPLWSLLVEPDFE